MAEEQAAENHGDEWAWIDIYDFAMQNLTCKFSRKKITIDIFEEMFANILEGYY